MPHGPPRAYMDEQNMSRIRTSSVDWSTVAVVGVGLIGGSLALALRRAGLATRVIGVSSPQTVADALALGAIDEGGPYDQLPRLVRDAGVVFLCTPISRIIELLPEVGRVASPGTLVTDVGSTKVAIMDAARKALPPGVAFIGGHPMAGSEQSGVRAADPFLFQNAMYVLTPTERTQDPLVRSFADGLGKIGARVLVLPAEVHDRVAAAVSHLPQLLALALVELVGDLNRREPAHLQMAAGGFRDMTRIASSPYRMWRDILRTNSGEIRDALAAFRERLDALDRELEDLEPYFATANQTRAAIPKDSKGFITPICDVFVRCQDTPGVLAKMTGALAAARINIMDLELLKVREGEGGTFRVSFKDDATAQEAISALEDAGFEARRR